MTIASMRDVYSGTLLPAIQAETFRHADQAFASRRIARGDTASPLPYAQKQLGNMTIAANGQQYDLVDYISQNRVAELLIVKDGKIAFEYYDTGNDASTRWVSMSMAKSFSTTLVGAAIQDGLIGSVEDELVRYLPALRGSAYEGVSIRQLMQMTSGVKWDDTQVDPRSERRHMLDLQIAQKPGAIMAYMASLPRVAKPGTVWNYSTGETHVVGALLQAVTGKWVADYLSEKIWSRAGMEADALWWLEAPGGLEVAGSGISATLRDYARFGQFLMTGGIIDGERILPEGWVREATAPNDLPGGRVNYGYMLWPLPDAAGSYADGAFSLRGIFGQYVYINPKERLTLVVLSARAKPKGSEAIPDNDFFHAAAASLK